MSENQSAVYTEEYLDRLYNLMNDESFTVKLQGKSNAEDVRKLFADNGVILDDVTLNTIKEKMQYYDDHGELDEDMLEFVSGGMKMSFWKRVKGSFAIVFNLIRKLVLQLLKHDKTLSGSMAGKREICAWRYDLAIDVLRNAAIS